MPANIQPGFALSGDVSSNNGTTMASTFTTAAADYTGATATHNHLIFTASANGAYVQRLRFKAAGTNVASVARIFINNGSANTVATNNAFYGEVSLPATTATTTTSQADVDYFIDLVLPPSFTIYVGLATTVAGGWVCIGIGVQY